MKNIFGRMRMAALLNVAGMTVAFVALYVISVWVWHGVSYNRGYRDADGIYMLAVGGYPGVGGKLVNWLPRPMFEAVMSEVPSVESGCIAGIDAADFQRLVRCRTAGGRTAYAHVGISEFSAGAFDVFGIKILEGSLDDFRNPDAVVVQRRVARMCGVSAGDTLVFPNGGKYGTGMKRFRVAAVCEDFPRNSDLRGAGVICPLSEWSETDYSNFAFTCFVRLADGCSPEDFEAEAEDAVRSYLVRAGYNPDNAGMYRLSLYRYSDFYFSEDFSDHTRGSHGSLVLVVSLIAIALAIMAMISINYVNFFLALVPRRIRAVNTRRILGSSRTALVLGLTGEAVLLAATALCIAPVLLFLLCRYGLLDAVNLDMSLASNAGVAAFVAAFSLLVAVAAGLYPALYITSFPPAFALKGFSAGNGRGRGLLRTAMTGVQFVVSVSLAIFVSFVYLQYRFMMNYDVGFDSRNLYEDFINMPPDAREAFTRELSLRPEVEGVAWSANPIVGNYMEGWTRRKDGREISFGSHAVSYNFPEVLGVELTEGRYFNEEDEAAGKCVMIFNESARREFGLCAGDTISTDEYGGTAVIVGFCKDFCYRPLHYSSGPFAFVASGWSYVHPMMYMRVAGGTSFARVMEIKDEALAASGQGAMRGLSQIHGFGVRIGMQYEGERQLSALVLLAALIAVTIAVTGVFGLVLFDSSGRRREIGIRRVFGASVCGILLSFNRRYVCMLLVCYAVAAPLGWFLSRSYLSGFAVRCPMHWWVFALVLLLFLAVTVAVVTVTCWRSANANPAESVRRE